MDFSDFFRLLDEFKNASGQEPDEIPAASISSSSASDSQFYTSIDPSEKRPAFDDFFEGGPYRTDLAKWQSLENHPEPEPVSYPYKKRSFYGDGTYDMRREAHLYTNMTSAQKDWYFWWRDQLERGNFIKTDLPYYLIYIYEKTASTAKNVSENYDTLTGFMDAHARAINPLLGDLALLLADMRFIFGLNNKGFGNWMENNVSSTYCDGYFFNAILEAKSMEDTLHLNLDTASTFCEYDILQSKGLKNPDTEKIWIQGYDLALQEADQWCRRKYKKGILAKFGPGRPKTYNFSIPRNPLQPEAFANYFQFKAKNYTGSPKFRQFMNGLLKETENTLRSIAGIPGKLRGYEIDPDLKTIVNHKLRQKLDPKYKPVLADAVSGKPGSNKPLSFDKKKIEQLRQESNAVRGALFVDENGETMIENPKMLDQAQTLIQKLDKNELSLLKSLLKKEKLKITDRRQALSYDINSKARALFHTGVLLISPDAKNVPWLEYESKWIPVFHILLMPEVPLQKPEEKQEAETSAEAQKQPDTAGSGSLPENTEKPGNTGSAESDALKDSQPASSSSLSVMDFVLALPDYQKEVLKIILSADGYAIQSGLERIAQENFTMPDLLADEINESFSDQFDDILIDTFSEPIRIEDQYVNELEECLK